ncbi:metal ABC transporter permease [Inquilinus limosus]|uniref:metal ABC transporter permease n=1 Tax=Inquilinus limosus TaxID=171674 RepID=UPI000691B4DD|nr:metal ABC transporter permease [Inquilinus limosus]
MTALLSLLEAAAEPLRHGFMVEAMLVAAFVGTVCAVLSCFVVLKGWALVGDAVSHAVLPGIILAYVAGLPMSLGAVASGMACVLSAGAIEARCRVKSDAVLGITFTGFLALGLVLLAETPSNVHFMHVLFGNLLGIEAADMVQTLAVGSVTLIAVLLLRKDLILFCFDPGQARVIGISPRRLELILLLLVAATIVAALQAVGVVLVMAMLVTPGCIGLLLADRFGRVMAAAVVSAVLSSVLGTLLSFWLDGATGPSIVVVQALLFALAFLFAPKKGLLRQAAAG